MAELFHIVNPVPAAEGSEMFRTQQLVFSSIERARAAGCGMPVSIHAISLEGEVYRLPDGVGQLPPLHDYFPEGPSRKLPFLDDILAAACERTDGYVVYSNSDIMLMPYFYEAVEHYIGQGHDAMIINRRRIPGSYLNGTSLAPMYAEAGLTHPGVDCMVFKSSLFRDFVRGRLCVGVAHAGNDVLYNLMAVAEKLLFLGHHHLTFHAGLELKKEWSTAKAESRNRAELQRVIGQVADRIKPHNIPGFHLPMLSRHFKWLMNPVLSYPVLARIDLKNLHFKRVQQTNPNSGYMEWLARSIEL